ncbi:MAG: class I SAM-dependent methyltransferase [Desulfomonile tiedjei]|nr:class I SAM-dependent methyltransferase [Desulfomonile tiedjei]
MNNQASPGVKPVSSGHRHEANTCPVCGDSETTLLGRRSDLTTIKGYAPYVTDLETFNREVFRCSVCGMQFIHPTYTEEELASLYECPGYERFLDDSFAVSNFTGPEGRDYLERHKVATIAEGFQAWGEEFQRKHSRKPRFLDVGCGRGTHLWVFQQIGFEVTGLDLSASHVEFVREELNIDVVRTSLDDFECKEKYDCIWACHVIEHVSCPHTFLKQLLKCLEKEGMIVLHTPLTDDTSLEQEKYRDIYHTLFFDPFTLGLLTAMHGLKCSGGNYNYFLIGSNVINFSMRFVRDHEPPLPTPREMIRMLRASYDPTHKELLRLGRHYLATRNPDLLERVWAFRKEHGIYKTLATSVQALREVLTGKRKSI